MLTSLSKETARITELINQEQMGEVESVWGEALEKEPTDIDTFLSLADKLYKSGHGEKGGTLLEQVINKLDELGEHRKAAIVLGELARIARRNPRQRELAEVVFKNSYGDLDGFESVVERAEEAAGGSDNRFVQSMSDQLKFQPGDWVFHDAGWGLGEVKEIRAEEGELRIDFEDKQDHKVKLGAAAKFFRRLPKDHIMVQRAANLDELKQLVKDEPVAVVLNILKGHNNVSNLKRIKAELVPKVIPTKSWAKWWTSTRKELAKHQYIKLGTGTNPGVERLVTAMTLEDETREQYENATRLRQKLDILRRYLRDSDKGEPRRELLSHVIADLKEVAHRDAELDTKPRSGHATLAGERILIHFLAQDLKKAEKELEFDLEYDVDELVKDSDLLLERLEEIQDVEYQGRALQRHAEINETEWPRTYAAAFLRDVPALWDTIAAKLMEEGHGKLLAESLATVQAENDQYPLQALWLAKRAILKGELPEGVNPGAANEVFGLVLATINKVLTRIERGEDKLKDALASLRSAMTERKSRLMSTVLSETSEERAAHLLHEVERCRGLSDAHSSTLRDMIMKAFPKLQVKASKALQAAEMEEEGAAEILATGAGRRKRQGELKRIQEEELPEVAKQIGEALAMGDISENAELDAAREKEGRLKDQAKQIMEELKRVRVVEPEEVNDSAAGFGTKVELKREDGKIRSYTILGRYEADHERFIISNESPIAKGILGRKPGESAVVETPEGAVKYEVISVERAL